MTLKIKFTLLTLLFTILSLNAQDKMYVMKDDAIKAEFDINTQVDSLVFHNNSNILQDSVYVMKSGLPLDKFHLYNDLDSIIFFKPNDIVNPSNDEIFTKNFGPIIKADFSGTILDQNKLPLEGASVSLGNLNTITDSNGVFFFQNANVYEKFAYIKVSKQGYIEGSRAIVPIQNETNYLKIILLNKTFISTVISGQQSSVSLPNGTKITFSGKFITESGNEYNNNVLVSAHYLAPSNTDTYYEMPGSLLGRSDNNMPVLLKTYGMITVNLYSSINPSEKLNINPIEPATIEIPIEQSQLANAPNEIPLWYFNTELGYWIKEGIAQKVNNKYIGKVSHFSFWNCDDFDSSVNLCITLKNNSNKAISNSNIILKRQNDDLQSSSGITNENGSVCGIIPSNELLTLSVFLECDNKISFYEKQIGPFLIDSQIDISLDIPEFTNSDITVSSIKCDTNEPITNGYAYFKNGDDSKVIPINNGIIQFNHMFCPTQLIASLTIYDLDSKTKSDVLEFTLKENSINLGPIALCNNANINKKIRYGGIELNSQEEVDSFGANGYTNVMGNIIIYDSNSGTPINNLGALETLLHVEGDFKISYTNLSNLYGLQNLTRINGSLIITQNSQLNSIEGLNSLSIVGKNLELTNNKLLSNISALQKLNYVGLDFTLYGSTGLLDYSSLNNLITVGEDLSVSYRTTTNVISIGFTNLKSAKNISIYADNITEISGFNSLESVVRLSISGYNSPLTNITGFNNLKNGAISISSLDNLEAIDGFKALINAEGVDISTNSKLTNIKGFNNLQSVSINFSLGGNPILNDASGFSNLTNAGNFSLNNNDSMTNLNDFSQLTAVAPNSNGSFKISDMDGLTDLTGLNNLKNISLNGVGDLQINDNRNLISLNGLNNLETIGGNFVIDNNDSLIDLDGLQKLQSIGNKTWHMGFIEIIRNDNLLSLNGLNGLIYVEGDIRIGVSWVISSLANRPNPKLANFCALQTLFTASFKGYTVEIKNNAYNPSEYAIEDGNCKL